MYLHRRTDIHLRTDTKDFALQNVNKGQQPVVLQLQKPHTAPYCGARTEKHALTCLLFPMYPRNCAMFKRERKRLYEFLPLCYLCFPANTTATASYYQPLTSMFVKAKLRILSRYFPKPKLSCLHKMLPVKVFPTSLHNKYNFNIANNAHYIIGHTHTHTHTHTHIYIYIQVYMFFARFLLRVSARTAPSSETTSYHLLKTICFL